MMASEIERIIAKLEHEQALCRRQMRDELLAFISFLVILGFASIVLGRVILGVVGGWRALLLLQNEWYCRAFFSPLFPMIAAALIWMKRSSRLSDEYHRQRMAARQEINALCDAETEQMTRQTAEIEAELHRLAVCSPWSSKAPIGRV